MQRDLMRAGITPYAWVINQSLAPLSLKDPMLRWRRFHERPFIQEVSEELAPGRLLFLGRPTLPSKRRQWFWGTVEHSLLV